MKNGTRAVWIPDAVVSISPCKDPHEQTGREEARICSSVDHQSLGALQEHIKPTLMLLCLTRLEQEAYHSSDLPHSLALRRRPLVPTAKRMNLAFSALSNCRASRHEVAEQLALTTTMATERRARDAIQLWGTLSRLIARSSGSQSRRLR